MFEVINHGNNCLRKVRLATVLGVLLLCSGGSLAVAHAGSPTNPESKALRSFLQKYLESGQSLDETARYSVAEVSLNGKPARQIFVLVTGEGWCGSGGCIVLLLEPRGSSFRVVDGFTLARLPIRILPSKTHGWHDITMPVAGGGIINGYTALLRFNGHKYPSNPSMAPRLPAKLVGTGMEVPLSESGSLLY